MRARGFTLAELIVVIAVIGILAVLGLPSLVSYLQAATAKAGAEELVAALNQARQLAIALNQSMCVEVSASQLRYRQASCTGTIWTGPGTDTNGWIRLQNNVSVTTNQNPVFSWLGAANPGATFTVTTPTGSRTASVVVSASGRIQIQ
jgi:type IV fimbrial biogenesis protein FimT